MAVTYNAWLVALSYLIAVVASFTALELGSRVTLSARRAARIWLIAGAFASDVTELMGTARVALWIFGHTHRAANLELRGTRIVSNPRGYPHQPVNEFDPGCLIEV